MICQFAGLKNSEALICWALKLRCNYVHLHLKACIFQSLDALPGGSDVRQAIAELELPLDAQVPRVVRIILVSQAPLVHREQLSRFQHSEDLTVDTDLNELTHRERFSFYQICWRYDKLKGKFFSLISVSYYAYSVRGVARRVEGVGCVEGTIRDWHVHEVTLHGNLFFCC